MKKGIGKRGRVTGLRAIRSNGRYLCVRGRKTSCLKKK